MNETNVKATIDNLNESQTVETIHLVYWKQEVNRAKLCFRYYDMNGNVWTPESELEWVKVYSYDMLTHRYYGVFEKSETHGDGVLYSNWFDGKEEFDRCVLDGEFEPERCDSDRRLHKVIESLSNDWENAKSDTDDIEYALDTVQEKYMNEFPEWYGEICEYIDEDNKKTYMALEGSDGKNFSNIDRERLVGNRTVMFEQLNGITEMIERYEAGINCPGGYDIWNGLVATQDSLTRTIAVLDETITKALLNKS